MKKENGFWIDKNRNRWLCAFYAEEKAKELSKTLTRCSGCTNCSHCIDCSNCTYCHYCHGCHYCNGCTKCTQIYYSRDCTDCSDCSACFYCSRCSNCNDCCYCHDFGENPQRIVGKKMGRRDANPAVYWLEVGEEQCVVGCFRGTLAELAERVKETHAQHKNTMMTI